MSASKYPNTRSRTLSLPTAITEVDIQTQLLEEYAAVSESSLSDPPEDLQSPTDSDSESFDHSSRSDSSGDLDYLSITPTSRPRVLDIERELSLTCVRAYQLHHVMRSAMLDAGLLGNINFNTDNKDALKPIISGVREQLGFLERSSKGNKGVNIGEKRLGELLWARARILNDNEKHNRYMVRVGKVGKRKDGSVDFREPIAEQVDHLDAPVVTSEEPSIATALERLDLEDMSAHAPGEAQDHTQEPIQDTPSSPMHLDTPVYTPSYPSAFVISVLNSKSGAAIHFSQLTSPSLPIPTPSTSISFSSSYQSKSA